MKKAFTLVEMLIVVVVIVTLMGISIRLGAIGTDSSHRNTTINRMQRIENALSGYYAAFGTYPPVKVHGSRNVYMPIDGCGLQTDGTPNRNIFSWNNLYDKEECRAWEQVEAACRAQPFGASFPPPNDPEWTTMINGLSEILSSHAQGNSSVSPERQAVLAAGFRSPCELISILRSQGGDKTDWRDIELFRYGVMSYLLPRYFVMCGSDEEFYTDFDQWREFNVCPRNPYNGNRQTWREVVIDCKSKDAKDTARILAIPSQAVCARWMPNFEGIVDCNYDNLLLFGVNIANKDNDSPNSFNGENTDIKIYRPGGSSASGNGDQYILDSLTILDGWQQEFYYYSEAPYQNYTLWSGGPNRRTFPPWVPRDSLQQSELERVSKWIGDDIIHMAH